jgi:hypothetical protein
MSPEPTSRREVTIRGSILRVGIAALAGAFVLAIVALALEWDHLRKQTGENPLAGLALLAAPLLGAFVGFFFGAAAGWLWLIVAVNREQRATRADRPADPSRTPPGS